MSAAPPDDPTPPRAQPRDLAAAELRAVLGLSYSDDIERAVLASRRELQIVQTAVQAAAIVPSHEMAMVQRVTEDLARERVGLERVTVDRTTLDLVRDSLEHLERSEAFSRDAARAQEFTRAAEALAVREGHLADLVDSATALDRSPFREFAASLAQIVDPLPHLTEVLRAAEATIERDHIIGRLVRDALSYQAVLSAAAGALRYEDVLSSIQLAPLMSPEQLGLVRDVQAAVLSAAADRAAPAPALGESEARADARTFLDALRERLAALMQRPGAYTNVLTALALAFTIWSDLDLRRAAEETEKRAEERAEKAEAKADERAARTDELLREMIEALTQQTTVQAPAPRPLRVRAQVVLRTKADSSSAVLTRLPAGVILREWYRDGSWLYVEVIEPRTEEPVVGWVYLRNLDPLP